MKKAAIYCRVSTEDQAREGTSLATQEERCRAFATAKGWDVAGLFVDDGQSGTRESRPALDRLLRACRSGDIGAVIVMKLDRLARKTELLLRLTRELEEADVSLAFVVDGVDTSTASGRFFRTILAGVAELERETILERTTAGRRKRAEAGAFTGGAPPYGFRISDGRLVVDENEAATLRLAASMVVDEGCTTGEVATRLNALGRLPRRAQRWEHINVRHHLQAKTLMGQWSYGKAGRYQQSGDPIPVDIPPILTPDRFAALQAALVAVTTRPTRTDRPYLLTGRLVGVCGSPFHGCYRSDRGTREYRCRNRRSEAPKKCGDRRITADDVEEVVWGAVVDLLAEPERLIAMARDYLGLRAGEVQVERDQLADIDRRIENLQAALSDRVAAALKAGVAPEALKTATRQIEEELDGLQKHRAHLEAWRERGEAQSRSVRRLWELADVAHARLADMSPVDRGRIIDLMDVRVTVLKHRSAGNRPRIRIEGTVYDRLVNALVDGPAVASPLGDLPMVASRHPGPRRR